MEKLKLCPFCGGKAKIIYYDTDGYLPQCTKCEGMIEKWFETEDEAVEAWNNRVGGIK